MDFREFFLAQHARAHASEVGQPDFSNQELILRDLTYERLRARPQPASSQQGLAVWRSRVLRLLFKYLLN